MKLNSLIFCFLILTYSCGSEQWNLNNTIGWNQDMKLYTSVYLQLDSFQTDSSRIYQKELINGKIVQKLIGKGLANKEDYIESDTSLFYLFQKPDYNKALNIFIEVINEEGIENKVKIYRREYKTLNKWKDFMVYSVNQQ